MLRESRLALVNPALRDRCETSAELRRRMRARACSSLEQTAVPALLALDSEATESRSGASAPALAAALASSAVTVVAALKLYFIFSAAHLWAASSATVAASLTDALRIMGDRGGAPGERIAPMLGRVLSRCFGSNYVPRLGYSIATARGKYTRRPPAA